MKYIAFIVLGLVLVAAITGIVLRANMPTAKLTVRAVRPTGRNFTYLLDDMPEAHWPVWEFAMTNVGRASAHWEAYLHLKDGKLQGVDPWAVNHNSMVGDLRAGESTVLQVAVPTDPRATWTVTVMYWPDKSPVEKKLDGWFKRVPMLRRRLPNDGDHFAYDVWHTNANLTAAH